MLLLIDNYDSFTFNLARYFQELGQQVQVVRNDALTIAQIEELAPRQIVISPGPGYPDDAGISLNILTEFAGVYPILGICLGHQCIGQAFGGTVCHAPSVVHGKTSAIFHHGTGLFRGCRQGFLATRYHSLVIAQATVPGCLEVTAWTCCKNGQQEAIMAVKHRYLPIFGVQFHPESVLSEHGHALLQNFLCS